MRLRGLLLTLVLFSPLPALSQDEPLPDTTAWCPNGETPGLLSHALDLALYLGIVALAFTLGYVLWLMVLPRRTAAHEKKAGVALKNALIGFVTFIAIVLAIDVIGRSFDIDWTDHVSDTGATTCVAAVRETLADYLAAYQVSPDEIAFLGADQGSIRSIAQYGVCDTPTPLCAPRPDLFGAAADEMAAICMLESGGGEDPAVASIVDRLRPDPKRRPFSIGLYQINLTTAHFSCEDPKTGALREYDCRAAFTKRPIRGYETVPIRIAGKTRYMPGENGYGKRIVDEKLYAECVAVLSDPACNAKVAGELFANAKGKPFGYGGFSPWLVSAKRCEVI